MRSHTWSRCTAHLGEMQLFLARLGLHSVITLHCIILEEGKWQSYDILVLVIADLCIMKNSTSAIADANLPKPQR